MLDLAHALMAPLAGCFLACLGLVRAWVFAKTLLR